MQAITLMNLLLFALLFSSLIAQGNCECSLSSVTVSQTQTGKTVENEPEWNVVISNGCICSQSELKLSCDGFQTVESIESSVLSKSGSECLINDGQPVPPFSNLTFVYAWTSSFPFQPLSSQLNCS